MFLYWKFKNILSAYQRFVRRQIMMALMELVLSGMESQVNDGHVYWESKHMCFSV